MINRGYIDISQKIAKSRKLNKKQVIKTERCSTDAYWIKNLEGKNYLFKIITNPNQEYRSIIIEEMAKQAGIDVVHTTLATLGYYKGELIEDYRKENCTYIPGYKILFEYFETHKNKEELQDLVPTYLRKDKLNETEWTELLKRLNNLETIWNALTFYYRKNPNNQEIVYKLTKDLANRFAFDFLTLQRDRHSGNWEIEENIDNNEINLTPLFDSNQSFLFSSFNLFFRVSDSYRLTEIYEQLEYYLTYSSNDFTNYFYSIYEKFTPTMLEQIIIDIEQKINAKIPTETRIEIIASYKEHYAKLTEIVEKRRKTR